MKNVRNSYTEFTGNLKEGNSREIYEFMAG
jgi:hypothetical protein